LLDNTDYTLTVLAYSLLKPSINATATAKFRVIPAPVRSKWKEWTGSFVDVSSLLPITLTAVPVDPLTDLTAPSYAWACENSWGGQCFSAAGQLVTMPDTATNTITFPAGYFDAGSYRFTCTVSKGSRVASPIALTLFITKLTPPTVGVRCPPANINHDSRVTLYSNVAAVYSGSVLRQSWQTFRGLASEPLNDFFGMGQTFISINDGQEAGWWEQGATYRIRLTAWEISSGRTLNATAECSFKVNLAPNYGSLVISPSSGIAHDSIHSQRPRLEQSWRRLHHGHASPDEVRILPLHVHWHLRVSGSHDIQQHQGGSACR
jgi:hypothetical protein